MAMDMNVALKITAGVTGQQAVDQLRTSMDKLDGAAKSVGRGFELAKTAFGAFLGLQAATGVVSFARSTLDAVDALKDMSNRTGIAVGTLSELGYAAKLNGSDIDAVQVAMGKMAAKAVDAATGNKTAAVTFDALGISIKNADGSMRSSVDLLQDLGDRFRDIKDPTLKSALAIEVLGKSGVAMIPVIENMRDARQEAKELGVTVGDDFANQAAQFNDNIDRMTAMTSSLAKSLLNELLPSLNSVMDAMVQATRAGESGMWAGLRQVTRNAAYDYSNLGKSITDVTAKIGRLEEMQKALSNDSVGASINRFFSPEDLATVNVQLTEARATLAQMKQMQNEGAGAGRGSVNPANARATDSVLDRINAAKAGEEADKAAAKTAEERKRILSGLNDEITKLVKGENALTIAKLRQLGATPQEIAQAEQLLNQKTRIAAADRAMDEAIKDQTKLEDEARKGKERLAEAGKRAYEDTRTPAEKLNIELARLNDLLGQGAIDWDTYGRAVFKAQDEFDNVGKKGKDTMDGLQQAIEGWGRQATDTFVEFAFTGKATFKDLVNSILQDIARMIIQKTIMAPLMAGIGGLFSGTDVGGYSSSGALFANGGIMTSQGSMPLNAYANGGIANSPQMAIFGEGRMPEAYVPLPDGRSIPVSMKGGAGGGGSVTVNVSVENGGEQVKSNGGAGDLGRAIAGAVKQELINQKRPGGLLAA